MRSPEVDFDVFDATTLEGSNRNWRELRDRCPVAWTEHNGGHWVITRYEEVAEAFLPVDAPLLGGARTVDGRESRRGVCGGELPLHG